MTILNQLLEALSKDERLVIDGKLAKNKIVELALNLDPTLLKILLTNEQLKSHFFTEVEGMLIFDKVAFQRFVNNKSFLPDSFTQFKNKIGLSEDHHYLSETSDVVLSWPFKDCILQGTQTDEKTKSFVETFWNESLSIDNIDNLLSPKALTNFKLYGDGNLDLTTEKNLIIRGNNLLALSSIRNRFRGAVKLIYIDPPYNTGSDSFKYNDSFNHSTWLTFMKNRLEIAKDFLSSDGVIFVQCDDNEQAYLKVLMDEVFGIDNEEVTLYVQVRFGNKTLNEDNDYQKLVEHIFVYSNGTYKPNKDKVPYSIDKFCYEIKELSEGKTEIIAGREVVILKEGEYSIQKVEPHENALKATWATGSLVNQGGSAAEFFYLNLKSRKASDGLGTLYKVVGMGTKGDGLGYRYISGPKKESAVNGLFYTGIPLDKKSKISSGKLDKEKPINNFIFDEDIYKDNLWDYKDSFGNCRTQGGVQFNSGKKPEQLLKRIIEISTQENDLVLDFHLGSGTTAAVSHKMNRRYIGIEQLNYGDNDSVQRLINVIEGDSTGVSKEVNWKKGGSFIYCELAQLSSLLVDRVFNSKNTDELLDIWNELKESPNLSYKLAPKDLDENLDLFGGLSFEDQQRFLIEAIDKNQLYVNYSDIDDETNGISDQDKKLNQQFYGA